MTIPGMAPVVAAGWLVATAAGAVAAPQLGSGRRDHGALTESGVPERDAHVCAEDIRRGGTLVTAKVRMNSVPEAERILGQDGSVDVSERRQEYEASGWSEFNQMRLHTGRMKSNAKACCAALGRLPGATSVTKGAVIEKAKLPADQAPAGQCYVQSEGALPRTARTGRRRGASLFRYRAA